MKTWKNCNSPAGLNFSGCGTRLTNLKDCPACKYGTLDLIKEGLFKCADCGAEFGGEMPDKKKK